MDQGDTENILIFFPLKGLKKPRNILRQIIVKTFRLNINLWSCRVKNFGVRQVTEETQRSEGKGVCIPLPPPPPPPPWLSLWFSHYNRKKLLFNFIQVSFIIWIMAAASLKAFYVISQMKKSTFLSLNRKEKWIISEYVLCETE